ncbi:NmrA-like family domain-containing protein [Gordonia polyisoprenivorans VH2]|uniref:NmrA-like family domain-containing protein n=1 Tax=Gordonia polyisoprenivorans (strain DSM 44266 / VH2) TaxID=1112204 RepID=H6MZH6_GORPV|nr:NmrA family NAD(P)-binding protein [Gordonia polyisoprenivorans]AFA75718.1 NmrA-like family domain-containing protein [Gordonia polyisoprenivorans VH2]OZC34342.1 NmrA family transcriptional regulator [Gordonia polyisoprenivorans]QUD82999.1 NmrA family NAD(P)-binding protein [Gordonia polyisoprenivorans]
MSTASTSTGPIAVLGATGGQGGAVVDALLDAGRSVRAVVRSPESSRAQALADRGVELAVADLMSGDGLTEAFAGVAGAFALTTPFESGVDAELTQGDAIIAAAHASALPYLVFSSVASADLNTGVPHFDSKYQVEQRLAATDIAHTVVGPTYFYDNIFGDRDALAAGLLLMAMPTEKPLQQLSRADLGSFVANLFGDPSAHVGKRIDIASDSVTPGQMAAVLSSVTGNDVHAESYDPERISSPDMRAMFGFLSTTGYSVNITQLHQQFPQVGWQSFAEWAAGAFGQGIDTP